MKESIGEIVPLSMVSKEIQKIVEIKNLRSIENCWICSRLHVGTNSIFKLTNTLINEDYVLKVYNGYSKVDHKLEHKIINYLTKLDLHPGIIYCSPEYRIEEFIEDSSINVFQLREDSKLLKAVELIASLHNNHQLKEEILPLLKDRTPFVLTVNELWLSTFRKLYPKIYATLSNTKFKQFAESLNWLLKDDFQKLFMSLIPTKDELVLSHNDISPANFLCTKNSDKEGMYLIDYEYCRLNFRGYDLAVLIEDIITDYDYKEYPTFMMHPELKLTDKEEDMLLRHYMGFGKDQETAEDFENDLSILKQEVASLKLVFQLAGTLWGMTTYNWSSEVFDENKCWRIEYALQRWVIFNKYLHNYLKDDKAIVSEV